MDSEFFLALDLIEKEKGISKSYMIEKIRAALVATVKKDNPAAADGVVVDVDPVKRKVRIYIEKTVVEEEITNPALEISLEEARTIDPDIQVGDKLPFDVDMDKFGRIAAQAGKQVIIQGIREAERGMVYEEFNSKEHEILTGLVTRIEPRNGSVHIRISGGSGATEAIMPAEERVPSEAIREGDHLKVYVVEVRRPVKGPQVVVSRTHPGLVKRLFELEVPEIYDGVVEIKSIAREAGVRTKLAVASNNPEVDPIGACIGPKGSRVGAVVEELRGEKMDIIPWSEDPEKFVAAALAPAEVYTSTLLEDGRSCRAVVPDNQLSLAIGKEGKNARLAARLTGYKIDIKPASEMAAQGSIKIDLSQLDLEELPEENLPEDVE
ncbi:MAG: transcription termination/antitermination protein NusA [Oscillospiraceae bacterium]|nr:transcription termination/antitermination protein NusA [Oscillospiraceae bacterium]